MKIDFGAYLPEKPEFSYWLGCVGLRYEGKEEFMFTADSCVKYTDAEMKAEIQTVITLTKNRSVSVCIALLMPNDEIQFNWYDINELKG